MPQMNTVREAYDQNASRYDRHAALEKEVRGRLLDRLTFRREEPLVVLDLGCGTGEASMVLKKTFRKALVAGIDLSSGMLGEAGRRSRLTRPLRFVNADMAALPFPRHCADLVFSNLALPWLDDKKQFFGEVSRVLKPGGMFLFSTYGMDSMAELGEALERCTNKPFSFEFPDLLALGDALTAAGFREPVMDVDRITLNYPDLDVLARELKATGTALLARDWLDDARDFRALAPAWKTVAGDNHFPLGFEILYGMAFGAPEGQPRRTPHGEVATFSVDSLLKSRNLGYD